MAIKVGVRSSGMSWVGIRCNFASAQVCTAMTEVIEILLTPYWLACGITLNFPQSMNMNLSTFGNDPKILTIQNAPLDTWT